MRTAIALGANLGDDLLEQLKKARTLIRPFHKGTDADFLQSPIYKTTPVNCPEGSPDFYNAVIEMEWTKSPELLLEVLSSIEHYMGRDRTLKRNAKRPIDLDILYVGDEECEEFALTLPHPRMVERRFVMQPLADICPDTSIVGTGKTVKEILAQLPVEDDFICVTTEW